VFISLKESNTLAAAHKTGEMTQHAKPISFQPSLGPLMKRFDHQQDTPPFPLN
jgi:hypothetical protein